MNWIRCQAVKREIMHRNKNTHMIRSCVSHYMQEFALRLRVSPQDNAVPIKKTVQNVMRTPNSIWRGAPLE